MDNPMRVDHRPLDNPMRVDHADHSLDDDDDQQTEKEEDPAKPSYTT